MGLGYTHRTLSQGGCMAGKIGGWGCKSRLSERYGGPWVEPPPVPAPLKSFGNKKWGKWVK